VLLRPATSRRTTREPIRRHNRSPRTSVAVALLHQPTLSFSERKPDHAPSNIGWRPRGGRTRLPPRVAPRTYPRVRRSRCVPFQLQRHVHKPAQVREPGIQREEVMLNRARGPTASTPHHTCHLPPSTGALPSLEGCHRSPGIVPHVQTIGLSSSACSVENKGSGSIHGTLLCLAEGVAVARLPASRRQHGGECHLPCHSC
jgi:hypothetical protein